MNYDLSVLSDRILATLDDQVSNFLYYDRKEDEDLPRGAIEKAIASGKISVDELVKHFRTVLENGLK